MFSNFKYKKKEKETKSMVNVNSSISDWISLKENEKVDDFFRKDNKIYCGEVQYNEYPLNDVDVETFRVFPRSKYSKDKNKVYYPLQIICQDGQNFGVCFCTEYVIIDADPRTFQYLGKDYALDYNHVYFRGKRIDKADSKSFTVLNGPKYFYFSVDKNNVYMHDEIFKEANPATFRYDENNSLNDTLISRYIIKDKFKTWEYFPPDQIKELTE